MSSRAAGSRRKLENPKPPKEKDTSSSKPLRSIFSRSRSATVTKPTAPVANSPPPWNQPQPQPSQSRPQLEQQPRFHSSPESQSAPAPRAVPLRSDQRRGDPYQASPPPSRSGYSGRREFSAYPSPQEPPRAVSPSISDFPAPPSRSFLEATYQPPPPSTSSPRPRPLPVRPMPNEKSQPVVLSSSPQQPPHQMMSPRTFHVVNSSLLLSQPERGDSPKPPSYRSNSPEHPQSMQIQTNEVDPQGYYSPESDYDSAYDGIYPSPPHSDSAQLFRPEFIADPFATSRRAYTPSGSNRQLPPASISQYNSADSSTGSSSSQSHAGPSLSSFSSDSSQQSASEPVTPQSPGFVFPGGRSTARPKPRGDGSPLKLRFKKRKVGAATPVPVLPPTPVSPPRHLNAIPPSTSGAGSSSGDIAPRRAGLPTPSNSGTSSTGSDVPPLARPRAASAATTHTMDSAKTSSTNSTSSSKSQEKPAFVYPGGRSRAQPKMQPVSLPNLKLKGRSSKKSTGSSSSDGKAKPSFLGISLKKKKSGSTTPDSPIAFHAPTLTEGSSDEFGDGTSEILSTTSHGGPAGPEFEAYRERAMQPEVRMHERMARIRSRIGSYPLDPYDSVLLDNDRHTGELLNRLNPTGSPTFYNYGNMPPTSVLDVGCGQGHWVVDAAVAWKGHGTRVTGYDMVDISKVVMPWAVRQGVAENIRFVRGNFLKQLLPFPDNSFDLVRMSCLTLAITADAWIFVFQEIHRVLSVGGRLELIDDSIIFPYGNPPQIFPSELAMSEGAPQLDIRIPSSTFSTFSVYDDSDIRNPGLGAIRDDDDDDIYELYQVQEEPEDDGDDTATIHGPEIERPQRFRMDVPETARPWKRERSLVSVQSYNRSQNWKKNASTSHDLEALFEHMITHKFGVHLNPEEFVVDLMLEVFGHARELATMHLSLAPPDTPLDDESLRGRGDTSREGDPKQPPSPSPTRTVRLPSRATGTPLSRSPGLILFPSTFIPMSQQELEIHSSKHLRMLLSCKKFLVEHAMEATDDEEIDEDSVLEALWEYEGFLRARFNRPPDCFDNGDDSPAPSIRGSIRSMSSDGQDAMWEYQTEMRQRFAWPTEDGTNSPSSQRSQLTPKVASPTQSAAPATSSPLAGDLGRRTPRVNNAPSYSRGETTHVRTFRVYEAIKFDEGILIDNSPLN